MLQGEITMTMAPTPKPPCARCQKRVRWPGTKYCPSCREFILRDLQKKGYLCSTENPSNLGRRWHGGSREDTHETKFGRDG